jgi:hypothetical protein
MKIRRMRKAKMKPYPRLSGEIFFLEYNYGVTEPKRKIRRLR